MSVPPPVQLHDVVGGKNLSKEDSAADFILNSVMKRFKLVFARNLFCNYVK